MNRYRSPFVYVLVSIALWACVGGQANEVLTPPQCNTYYRAVVETHQQLQVAASNSKTKKSLNQLDPEHGTGFLTFDVSGAFPEFLKDGKHKQIDWPEKGTFVFDGDKSVPHYVDIASAQKELEGVMGKDRVLELQGFSTAMLRFVYEQLPEIEKQKMAKNKVGLVMDLAEMRVCETTGCPLHIDWYPREGMVMIIPIYGDRTRVHHKDPSISKAATNPKIPDGEIHASLISAYGRWANFHAFDPDGKPHPGWRDNGQGVIVPEGVKEYLGSRGKEIPDDLKPEAPGVLPTVHQAATGPRMVMVLNFSYRPLEGIQGPYAAQRPAAPAFGPKLFEVEQPLRSFRPPLALPNPKVNPGRMTAPFRSSGDSTGNPEADFHYMMRLLGYDDHPAALTEELE